MKKFRYFEQGGFFVVVSFFLLSCAAEEEQSTGAVDASLSKPDAPKSSTCPKAEALYAGAIENPRAGDDGQTLEFVGDLNTEDSPDRLRLRLPANAAEPIGNFTFPSSEYQVLICLDDKDERCSDALVAYSGSLQVSSVVGRLQANLSQIIFVDNLTNPSCSAAFKQSSIDVAIGGPL